MSWVRSSVIVSLVSLGLSAQEAIPLQVGLPLPPLLDLRDAQPEGLVPQDARDPAQVEAARRAWTPRIAGFASAPALRLRLPVDDRRLSLLLAASQALKAQNPNQRLYLAFEPQASALWNEAAWGALEGGILGPEDLGEKPERWRDLLTSAQSQLPGRPWFLWMGLDPMAQASLLMGDGGRLVVPAGGPTARLAAAIPRDFLDVEGGLGDLSLRKGDKVLRWRFTGQVWAPTEPAKDRNVVAVSARESYDVQALLARMRATQLRDTAAIQSLEASLDVDLHIQSDRGPGADLGFRFRAFDRLGEPEETLQKEVVFNGVRANLPGEVQLPIVESRTSLAAPVALGLTERYRYSDGGAGIPGRRLIHFEPVEADPLLYRGTLDVEEATGRVWVERSARSGLPGIVKSESRTLTYAAPAPGLWRVVKTETFERWVTAGGVAQVRRVLAYRDFKVNDPAFLEHRAQAREGKGTMLRQTVEGARYFTRQTDGTRKVEERPKTSGSGLGGGLLMDPRMKPPALPFAGLAYFDYNALNRGIQVSGITAGLFNAGNVAVPNVGWGVDLSARAAAMLWPGTERVVRNGALVDGEAVDHSGGSGRIALGRDLGAGFRIEAAGTFGYDHYKNTQDKDHKTEGFALPPSGWSQGWRSSLNWQFRGFQLQGFYGENHRPDGTYGTLDNPQSIPDGGRSAFWGGSLGLDHQLESRWQVHGELGHETARGVDRFLDLSEDARAVGMRALPVADRLDYAQVTLTLPPTPSVRLSTSLNHSRMRAVDDQKTYRFTGLTLSGDLPGFGWFTTIRVDLQSGLQSDIPGNRSLRGYLMLLKVF